MWNGPLSKVLATSYNRLNHDACQALGRDAWSTTGNDDDYPKRHYLWFIERLIHHVEVQAHGGTLIIVPESISANDPRLTDRVMIKYVCDYFEPWKTVLHTLIAQGRYFDKVFAAYDQSQVSASDFQLVQRLSSDMDSAFEDEWELCRAIASLTAIDGAVVMTTDLRVLGFGAEVIAQSHSLKEVILADSETFVSINAFGTRHRSAFRFCSSFEESIAIVVSSDGGAKGIKRVGQNVHFWPDIGRNDMTL